MCNKYQLNGINNDTETCEQCGKTGLKRVMWLEVLDEDGNSTGSVIPMGVCCGAKALGFNGKFTSFEQVIEAVENRNKMEVMIEKAKKLAIEFNDEIAIIKKDNSYITVRGKAYDKNPRLYGIPSKWVKPE